MLVLIDNLLKFFVSQRHERNLKVILLAFYELLRSILLPLTFPLIKCATAFQTREGALLIVYVLLFLIFLINQGRPLELRMIGKLWVRLYNIVDHKTKMQNFLIHTLVL